MSARQGLPGTAAQAMALQDGARCWTHAVLEQEQRAAAQLLASGSTRVLATLMDNGPAWVIADGAAMRAQAVHVPLPAFFTPEQLRHALGSAGVDTLLAPTLLAGGLAAALGAGPVQDCEIGGEPLGLVRFPVASAQLPPGTAKITFTSGTTGTPKGVCLSLEAMQAVAQGLVQAMEFLDIRRHLCALPLAVLLENIAGLMAPMARGATCIVPSLAEVGLTGSSGFDPAQFHSAVSRYRPDSVILLPQMLRAWVGWLQQSGRNAPDTLRMVAVGGAAVGERLLVAARGLGIPAYEGYGLSEGASVQTLNLPGGDRAGSAGRPLPHARLRVAADGEIEIAGSLMAGYVGEDEPSPEWWPTGDLGRIDADGFLHLQGRKKHVLITAFGRNISPEWVEQALGSEPSVAQAVVFGDGEPALGAVLWPVAPDAPDDVLKAAVDAANHGLPDYARVRRWVRARAAFSPHTGMATPNGRPRRDVIWQSHADALMSDGEVFISKDPMRFSLELQQQTADARHHLLGAPIIQGCLRGEVSLASYLAFLGEAYHHVRHTVPLLRACKAALPARHAWLHGPLDEYVQDELGHDEWILDDIRACGGDPDAVRTGQPGHAVEVMVACAYDTIARGNPLGFFGMVHVLEGTSVSLALLAADRIQQPLGLPDAAFSYLRSHGTLDREHTAHLAQLMDRIDDPLDRADIVHAARAFYRLYGDVFRGLPLPHAAAVSMPAETA